MIDIDEYLQIFTEKLKQEFGTRLVFVGLQGSFRRNEATDQSDIDVVAILDTMNAEDVKRYDAAVFALPGRDRLCGFVSGLPELEHWDRGELFSFCLDTRWVYGQKDLLDRLAQQGYPVGAAHTGACSIYHACCHNMLHEKSALMLKELYKSAVFVLRALWYLQNNELISTRTQLKDRLKGRDQDVLLLAERAKNEPGAFLSSDDFEQASGVLFTWAGDVIRTIGGKRA